MKPSKDEKARRASIRRDTALMLSWSAGFDLVSDDENVQKALLRANATIDEMLVKFREGIERALLDL